MSPKYIFITGGVISSLGKGLAMASVGSLLESKGFKIAMLKLDPYLNVDPGTMNPFQHGEVYVTEDGAETDLDLGHYFRFTNSPLSASSNATSGQIYDTVIKKERRGDYLGKTVQVIPHITDEIKNRIHECAKKAKKPDVVIVEVGGTIGDIESLPFLEAIRQFCNKKPQDCINIHMTYVPYIKASAEIKTKPTQHSTQTLRSIGLSPDIIVCRSERALSTEIKDKIALFCNVKRECVINAIDVRSNIYEVPINLHDQGIEKMICQLLNLDGKKVDLSAWENIVNIKKNPKGKIKVGFVGKYVKHRDAYKSIFEALEHGAITAGYELQIKTFEADKIVESENTEDLIGDCHGYVVPGGFGERGWIGKIRCAKYCRENKIPYFGICWGMHILAVEFARNVAGIEDANSTEVEPGTKNPIISLLAEQKEISDMGGTMRLGNYTCILKKGSKAYEAYGKREIHERHRHRYEFNNKYKEVLENAGLVISGTLEDSDLCEIMEVKDHPWMLASQFHPEFNSKPTSCNPLFRDFIRAVINYKFA